MNIETTKQQIKYWREHADRLEATLPPEPAWTLCRELPGFRALRDGEEWANHDRWTRAKLGDGNRPMIVGEMGSYELSFDDGKTWKEGLGYKIAEPKTSDGLRRTKRPLPILTAAQVAEGWKEHTGGENPAPGKQTEMLMRDTNTSRRDADFYSWSHCGDYNDIIAYRVIEPKLVPLGPEDVSPISLIRRKGDDRTWNWRLLSYVHASHAICADRAYEWAELKEDYEINRPKYRDADGKPTRWEPCHKEAGQ